jgi:hypothetical protein
VINDLVTLLVINDLVTPKRLRETSLLFFESTKGKLMEIRTKIEAVKAHFNRNKERYIMGAIFVGTNAIWYVATKNGGSSSEITVPGNHNNLEVNHIANQYNFAPKRLSYIVTDGERWWGSQVEAAKTIGENPANVSKHLNHGVDLKSGVKLERVGVRN